jgi:hypothetical protein
MTFYPSGFEFLVSDTTFWFHAPLFVAAKAARRGTNTLDETNKDFVVE